MTTKKIYGPHMVFQPELLPLDYMLLNRPALNAGLESEYAAWTSKCYQVTGAYKAAIRAGAKEPSDG